MSAPISPPSKILQILDGATPISPRCITQLRHSPYHPGGAFQSLLKSGEDEPSISAFLVNQFGFKLQASTKLYQADPRMSDCNNLGQSFLVNERQLIAIHGGFLFHSFTRATNVSTSTQYKKNPITNGLNVSPLPFSVSSYMTLCAPKIQTIKQVPQATSKCAPLYFPHVASSESQDKLTRIIGSHAYQAGGADNESKDYNNPIQHNLHPVFLIFPPMGDVLLVRVDDMERANNRDPIRGAYIAIKNDTVTGQLNEACSFDAAYLCSGGGGKPKFQLIESGEFVRIQ
ncbi:MAG: hypothetical protein ACOYNB_00750 [Aquabacterium sp.]